MGLKSSAKQVRSVGGATRLLVHPRAQSKQE
jgi:hypothetical protein